MEVIRTAIDGVVIIEPRVFRDSRGYFFESFNLKEFEQKVRPVNFVQDNESCSSYGVLRGLHFQKPPFAQSKLGTYAGARPRSGSTSQWNFPGRTTGSFSFQGDSRTVFAY